MDAMDAIKVTYFQECEELLASLEEGLLALDAGTGDGDTINAVFRAVHSVKGGAGAFGFESLVAFAHIFETTLDEMRSGKLDPSPDVLKIMLRAYDVLADYVQAAKAGGKVNEARAAAMTDELRALTTASPSESKPKPAVETQSPAPAADDWGFTPVQFDVGDFQSPQGAWHLVMRPTHAMYAKGHDALLFLRELARLASIEVELDASAMPELGALDAETPYLTWSVVLPSEVDEAAIRDVFDFVGDDCPIELSRAGVVNVPTPATVTPVPSIAPPAENAAPKPEGKRADESANAKAAAGTTTIRVNLDRVDRMIDLVGELVINQAMLAQRVAETGLSRSSTVAIGLDELEQLTREIQDSVMAIRAQPVKSVFQRMPRLVREIADATGKQVRLIMDGEGTEVDKTVIECLSDPITHMLRNAIDHGVEPPEDRVAAGKGPEGTVRLSALHRSGRIVIEVADDGKGIDRPRVRDIAVKKGLISADANLTEEEIDNLIFLPGFSTATTVSNISGRGVGMDVVKRSIQALSGRISISSQPGKGSKFTLSLPLTLAVLDGMVLNVGGQTLVAPLTAIIETLKPKPSEVHQLGPRGTVLSVRGSYVELIDIGVALGQRTAPIDATTGVVLLVEGEGGGRAALVADEIQGQRQVVIKSLEANFRHVDGVAAATILGDGRVALILDVEALIDRRQNGRCEPLAKAS